MTFAGLGLGGTPAIGTPDAHSMPSKTSSKVPPHAPSVRTGRMLRVAVDAGDADAVVGVRGDQSGDERAVPEAGRAGTPPHSPSSLPVALVARIRVAAVAVARVVGIGDEVVAGRGSRPTRSGAAGCRCRSPRRVTTGEPRAAGPTPAEALMPATGSKSAHCLRIQRIVRDGPRILAQHRVGVLDARILLQLRGELRRACRRVCGCASAAPRRCRSALDRDRHAERASVNRGSKRRPVRRDAVGETHHQLAPMSLAGPVSGRCSGRPPCACASSAPSRAAPRARPRARSDPCAAPAAAASGRRRRAARPRRAPARRCAWCRSASASCRRAPRAVPAPRQASVPGAAASGCSMTRSVVIVAARARRQRSRTSERASRPCGASAKRCQALRSAIANAGPAFIERLPAAMIGDRSGMQAPMPRGIGPAI